MNLNYSSDVEKYIDLLDIPPQRLVDCKITEQELISNLASRLEQTKIDLLNTSKKLTKPYKIAVVVAMWGEHNRLRKKTMANQTGENALVEKANQLSKLFENIENISWTLYLVDDGCPHNSGQIAQKLIVENQLEEHVRVIYLQDAIDSEIIPLNSVDESRKGGSIAYGAATAIKEGAQIVIYTDLDLSVHLGQMGSLVNTLLKSSDIKAAIGDRNHKDSIKIKNASRWGDGVKFFRHIQRLVGKEIFGIGITDTQVSFKAFSAEAIEVILKEQKVFDFSFDTDWLLSIIKKFGAQKIARLPVVFIDSDKESVSIQQEAEYPGMKTWEQLLKGITKTVLAKSIYVDNELATTIQALSPEKLYLLVKTVPEQLKLARNEDLGNPEIMSPEEIVLYIKQVTEQRQ